MIRRFALVLALAPALAHLCGAPAAPATASAAAPATLSAPVLDGTSSAMDMATGETVITGNCSWRSGLLLVTADEFHYNRKTEVVIAIGHVTLTIGEERLLADRLEFHRLDNSFTAEFLRLGQYPFYISGASAEGTIGKDQRLKEVSIHQARISYTDPGRWKPASRADTIIYSPGHFVRMVRSLVGVGGAEIIPISRMSENLTEAFTADYFSFELGYRNSLGGSLDIGVHVPVFDGSHLGGDIAYFTKRGLMLGPSGTYASTDGSGDLKGSLTSGFIHDYGLRTAGLLASTDILGRPVPVDRGYVDWTHQQQLAPNVTFDADINWWSDSEVVRDFHPKQFYQVQEPDNYLEAVYTGQNSFAEAFARLQPDSFEPVQERLPDLSYTLLPTAIGGGFFERFSADAVSLLDRPPGGGQELSSDRLDTFYGLYRPYSPTSWFTFTPVVGGRITNYSDTTGAEDNGGYTRVLGEIGFDTVLRASGTFIYQNPSWDINGLRHLITPTLSYRYIPEADKGQASIPVIDGTTFTTYLPPLELGDMRSIDQLHPVNTLRLGLDNILQTRDNQYGSRNLVELNIADDVNFQRTVDDPDFSDVHYDLAVTPARWLQFNLAEIFSPTRFTLREFDSGLILRDGDQWTLRLAEDFLRHEDDDYLLDYTERFSEKYSGLLQAEYGARQHQFNQRAVGLVENLVNTWRIEYLLTYNGGPNRSGIGLGLQVNVTTIRF